MDLEISKDNPVKSRDPATRLIEKENWRKFRTHIENSKTKSNITRYYPRRKWILFTCFLKVFGFFIWLSRLSVIGKRYALDLKLNPLDIEIKGLPQNLHGLKILHLTDLHFDRVKGVEKKIVGVLGSEVPDLIIMTGDYKDKMKMPAEYYTPAFNYLSKNLKSKMGIFAVLGNHDSADLVPVMEKEGIKVLVNESVELSKGGTKFTLTGVDDVHYFFSPAALESLEEAPENSLKILLVHSPEMVKEAALRRYSLYLSGHTHGGQIATTRGKAIVTHLNTGKEFAVGRWNYQGLEGYTSSGAGVSGLTVRFFTQSEVALIRLLAKAV